MPACRPNRPKLHDAAAGGASDPKGSGRFTRRLRLLKPDEFKRVFAKARKLGGKYLTVLVRHNELGHPRLGLAISRKSVKTAVGRNLIKRQVRESFRLHQDIIGNFDVVVVSKPGVGKLSRHELRVQLDRYWQELAEQCEKS